MHLSIHPHLTRYYFILFCLWTPSIHKTRSCLRLCLLYFFDTKLLLDILDFFSNINEFIILWLQLFLLINEYRYHFFVYLSFLIFSQSKLINLICQFAKIRFYVRSFRFFVHIFKPICIFVSTRYFIFRRKFELLHLFFDWLRVISTRCRLGLLSYAEAQICVVRHCHFLFHVDGSITTFLCLTHASQVAKFGAFFQKEKWIDVSARIGFHDFSFAVKYCL